MGGLTFGLRNTHPCAMASSGAGPSYGKPRPTKILERCWRYVYVGNEWWRGKEGRDEKSIHIYMYVHDNDVKKTMQHNTTWISCSWVGLKPTILWMLDRWLYTRLYRIYTCTHSYNSWRGQTSYSVCWTVVSISVVLISSSYTMYLFSRENMLTYCLALLWRNCNSARLSCHR